MVLSETVELSWETLDIIACGCIGPLVASCASTMGMTVMCYDPIMPADELGELAVLPPWE